MIYCVFLVLMFLAAFLLQECVPVTIAILEALLSAVFDAGVGDLLHRAKVLFLQAYFFAAAMSVPFPAMLGLALLSGIAWDATNALIWSEGSPGFGAGPLLLGFLGAVANGAYGLVIQGKRLMPVMLAGACIFVFLVSEYLWINFRAGDFQFPVGFWVKTAGTAVLTCAVVPVFLSALSWGRIATGFGKESYLPEFR